MSTIEWIILAAVLVVQFGVFVLIVRLLLRGAVAELLGYVAGMAEHVAQEMKTQPRIPHGLPIVDVRPIQERDL